MRKNGVSAAGSETSAEALDWKPTAAGVPQNKVIVSSFTFYSVHVCMDSIATDYKVLQMKSFFNRENGDSKALAAIQPSKPLNCVAYEPCNSLKK